MDLHHAVALVTGANRGLGRAFAQALLAQGAKVYAAARDPATITLAGVTPLRLDVLSTKKARGSLDVNGAMGVRTEPELISQLRALPGVSRVSLALHRPWQQGG